MRILIVDDDTRLLAALHRILEQRGHEVTAFSRAVLALERLAEPPPFDALLTDIEMPEMDGIDLALAARRLDPGLPIAFMTGGGRPIDAFGEPADVLHKPWSSEELTATLGRLTRSSSLGA